MNYEFDRYGRPIGRAIGGAMDAIGGLFSRDPKVQAQVDEAKRQRMMALPDDHPNKIDFLLQQRQMTPVPQRQMTPVPPASNLPRENVVPRVANPDDNPFTGQVMIDGKPPTDAQMGRFKRDRWGRGEWEPNFGQPPEQPVVQQQPSMFDDIKEYMFAGKDQQGLFGGTGVDPKTGENRGSMGLGGAFGRLFNNPNRMAMLSGGLTALDPSSYYDKEGFQSPWTGLRSGLGGAQAGYKSVIDRRKAEAETALAKAKTAAEGEDVSKWKHAPLGDAALLYSNKEINRERKRLMQQDPTLSITEANQQAVQNTSIRKEKGIPKKSMFEIKKAFTSGQGQLAQIDILEGYAQDAFNAGWAGMGKRAWDAIKGAASIDTDTTESTKLVNGINQLVSQNWKEIVGSGPLSKGDKEFIDLVVKSPKSVFTTASEIRSSLSRLKRILRESQGRRAETIGVDYDPSAGPAPTLSGGDDIDALIKEFE